MFSSVNLRKAKKVVKVKDLRKKLICWLISVLNVFSFLSHKYKQGNSKHVPLAWRQHPPPGLRTQDHLCLISSVNVHEKAPLASGPPWGGTWGTWAPALGGHQRLRASRPPWGGTWGTWAPALGGHQRLRASGPPWGGTWGTWARLRQHAVRTPVQPHPEASVH